MKFSAKTASIFLTLILGIFPKMSVAEPDRGQSWKKIVQSLQDEGIHQIGDLNLDKFAKDAETLNWNLNATHTAPPEFADGRKSAYFLTNEKKIVLNSLHLLAYPEATPQLELHEALGALKYNDRYYAVSTALSQLAQTKDTSIKAKLLTLFADTVLTDVSSNSTSGTGTSVGGGGDAKALIVKNRVLANILKTEKNISWDFLSIYPEIAFEPFYESQQQFVAVKFQGWRPGVGIAPIPGVRFRAGKYQELVSIYFPALLWDKDSASREKILREIQAKVVDLFPPYLDSLMLRFNPGWCAEKDSFSFDKTKSSDFARVQRLRATLRNNCDVSFITEIRVPKFLDSHGNYVTSRKTEQQLKNQVAYACSLKSDEYTQSETVYVDRRSPGVIAKNLAMNDSRSSAASNIAIFIETGSEAEIKSLTIVNVDAPSTSSNKAKSLSPTGDTVLAKLKSVFGQNIQYACVRK